MAEMISSGLNAIIIKVAAMGEDFFYCHLVFLSAKNSM